jgi:N-acetylglucosamine kinase-like BadF-type ATPase
MPMAMYNGQISRDGVAEAAADVLEAWREGDHVAAEVVRSGLDALARRVRTVAARVQLADPLVCLSGGVFRSMPYAAAFTAAVKRLLPTAGVQPARLSPAAGAVLLAFRTAGIALTDAMRDALVASAFEDRP